MTKLLKEKPMVTEEMETMDAPPVEAAEDQIGEEMALEPDLQASPFDGDNELREIYDRRAAAEAESLNDSERAKASKKRLEAINDELVRAVGKRVHPPAAPLFDRPAEDAPDDAALDTLLADLTGPDGQTLPPRVLKALAEHPTPILTVRELTAWQTTKGLYWAKDIHGLGEAGAGKLDEAMILFWEKHPQAEADPILPDND